MQIAFGDERNTISIEHFGTEGGVACVDNDGSILPESRLPRGTPTALQCTRMMLEAAKCGDVLYPDGAIQFDLNGHHVDIPLGAERYDCPVAWTTAETYHDILPSYIRDQKSPWKLDFDASVMIARAQSDRGDRSPVYKSSMPSTRTAFP